MSWQQPWSTAAEAAAIAALRAVGMALSELPSQEWNSTTSAIGGVRDHRCSFIGSAGSRFSFMLLHLNATFQEEFASALSLKQPAPVVVFSEVDQTIWGYSLWQLGKKLDGFWSDPEYLAVEPSTCEGNAAVVAAAFGVQEDVVEPYLRRPVDGQNAHLDDEHPLDDHWVRLDLMRRLSINYPDLTTDNGRHVLLSLNET